MDTQIHDEFYKTIVDWAKKPAPRDPPAVFLYGPPGIGKTTLIKGALSKCLVDFIEYDLESSEPYINKIEYSVLACELYFSENRTNYIFLFSLIIL